MIVLLEIYFLYNLCTPSKTLTRYLQRKFCSIRISISFRMVSSGFVSSQTILLLCSTTSFTNSDKSLIVVSSPVQMLTNSPMSLASYFLITNSSASAKSSTYKSSRRGVFVPQSTASVRHVVYFSFVKFPDQSGKYMGTL